MLTCHHGNTESRLHISLLSFPKGVLAVLPHEVVDGFTKEALDTRVGIESELVESSANSRTEIANDRLLSLTWISRLRGRLRGCWFLCLHAAWRRSRRDLLEPCESTAHAAPRSMLTSLRVGMLTRSHNHFHSEAMSSAALPLGSISGAVLPAPTL